MGHTVGLMVRRQIGPPASIDMVAVRAYIGGAYHSVCRPTAVLALSLRSRGAGVSLLGSRAVVPIGPDDNWRLFVIVVPHRPVMPP